MIDKLGNDAIKLQKEIMNITYNINTVRDKTHKSMSSILNGLKSFPKYKSSNHMLDLSQKKRNKNQKMKIINDKYYSNFNNSHAVYRKNSHLGTKKNSSKLMNEFYCNSKKKIINYKQKIDKQIPNKNNGIVLGEFENYYNHNKKDSFYKNSLLLEKLNNIKKDNQPVKYEINNYNNYMSNNNMSNDENIILNDNSKLNHQIKNNKKIMPKTDSFKYLYHNNNYSNDYIYNEIDDIYKRNYIFDNEYNNNYNKKDLRHSHFINKILNENTSMDIKINRKSRNKSENEFKHKEIEMEKNNDEAIEYKDFFNKKASKTFYSDIMQKNNNYNNYISKANKNTHHKKHKNKFREKASTKHNSKDKNKYNDYNTFNEIDLDDNINHIYKLLNAKNQIDCIYKINKLIEYEDFIHKLKKLYYNFNDHNKDFKLKDILFWISMNSCDNNNNNRKKNKYEEFCHEIMKKFNIHDFENFKIFFYKLVKKDKDSHYFVNEMKELFNNFNEFQPNKTIYRNRSNKSIQNFSKNEDDIHN